MKRGNDDPPKHTKPHEKSYQFELVRVLSWIVGKSSEDPMAKVYHGRLRDLLVFAARIAVAIL